MVQSHRAKGPINPNIKGTQELTPSYEDHHNRHKQTDWPSNRLLSSQMGNFHAMRHELVAMADSEFIDTRKEHNALKQFTKTS